jgi:hypothetical protein
VAWGDAERALRLAISLLDLCHLIGQPTPTEADPTGDFYAFEKGAEKTVGPTGGGQGWADVWK